MYYFLMVYIWGERLVSCQVKRYTISRPNTMSGIELYSLSGDILKLKSKREAQTWVKCFLEWIKKYQREHAITYLDKELRNFERREFRQWCNNP